MSRRSKTVFLVAGLLLLAIVMVACGPAQELDDEIATATARASESPAVVQDETSEDVAEETSVAGPAADAEDAAESEFDIFAGLGDGAFETTDSGLRYTILEASNSGEQPESGQIVSVHYTGWLEDGTVFDNSIDRGQPLSFALGEGGIIAGWEEGIALLELGDKARLIIPSELGYGEAGGGPIPPNATLIFDVELVDIVDGPPEAPVAVDAGDYVVKDNGIQYYDMVVGDGQSAEMGLAVVMDVTMWLADGTQLGSTIGTGQPIPAILDGSQLFPGWEDGIVGMRVGGSRQVVVPPDLTLREADIAAGAAPPDDDVIIEIDLLDVFEPEQ